MQQSRTAQSVAAGHHPRPPVERRSREHGAWHRRQTAGEGAGDLAEPAVVEGEAAQYAAQGGIVALAGEVGAEVEAVGRRQAELVEAGEDGVAWRRHQTEVGDPGRDGVGQPQPGGATGQRRGDQGVARGVEGAHVAARHHRARAALHHCRKLAAGAEGEGQLVVRIDEGGA